LDLTLSDVEDESLQAIIHLNPFDGFSIINHPAIGVPPFIEAPKWILGDILNLVRIVVSSDLW
jgi:hypothetical protein